MGEVHKPVGVAVIGVGYWGPNLVRNFHQLQDANLLWVCDQNRKALDGIAAKYPYVKTSVDPGSALNDPDVEGVVMPLPASLHYEFAKSALKAGKHVFVEKPICLKTEDAEDLIRIAAERDLRLMVGHLLIYHPAITYLKSAMDQGVLGERIYYVYSQRVNLGKIRTEENSLWSLAPHDISIILYLTGLRPVEVSAVGRAFIQKDIEDVVFATIGFDNGSLAHMHVSWLDPHKLRRLTLVGDKKMAVFDDMQTGEMVRIYDKGVDGPTGYASYGEALSLRTGEIFIPRIPAGEPLKIECQEFLDAIREGRAARTPGEAGLEVVRVLEAAERSLKSGGVAAPV